MEKSDQNRFRDYCHYLAAAVAEPFFVKVGANDGITGDPCSTDILLAAANWKGLLIEPVPYCFDRLKANFPDRIRFRLEQVAIGASKTEESFFYVDANAAHSLPSLPSWFDQLGSFKKEHILKHLSGTLEPFIIECKVPVCRLSDVLARHGIHDLHLLHVDAEGHDYEVLKTLDFAIHSPFSIFVEHKHLIDAQRKELLSLLLEHGYSIVDCVTDYFAVNEKSNARLNRR